MKSGDLKSINYKVDASAHEQIWAHCSSIIFLSNVIDMIEEIDNDYQPEICVTKADEAGKFNGMGSSGLGLFIKGKVTAMFKRDIGSTVASDGFSREFHRSDIEVLVSDYSDLVADYSDIKNTNNFTWTESFLVPSEVVGIWMTKEVNEKINKKQLKRLLGDLPITII